MLIFYFASPLIANPLTSANFSLKLLKINHLKELYNIINRCLGGTDRVDNNNWFRFVFGE
jgi:hypothetical protein